MSQYSQYDDIKDLFNSVKVPEIDLKEKIRSRLEMNTPLVRHKIPKHRVILLCIIFIMILSVGAAAKSGVFKSFLNNLNNLKQGESAVWNFFNSYSNKNETVYVSKPVTFNSFEELKNAVGDGFVYPGHLPEGYMFKEGLLKYLPSYSYESVNESTGEKQDEFKAVVTTDSIMDYTLIYSNGRNQVSINVSMIKASGESSINIQNEDKDSFSNIEEVKVNGNRAIYAVYAIGNKLLVYRDGSYKEEEVGGQQVLRWLNDKRVVTLTIDPENTISRDNLISIAENIEKVE